MQHATSNESGKGQSVRQSLLDLPVLFQMTPGGSLCRGPVTHTLPSHSSFRAQDSLSLERQTDFNYFVYLIAIQSSKLSRKAIYTGINKTVSDTTTKHLQFTRQLLLNIKIVCSS